MKVRVMCLVLCVFVFASIFCGCGSNGNTEIIGKWVPTTAKTDGETISYSELGIDEDQFGLDFKDSSPLRERNQSSSRKRKPPLEQRAAFRQVEERRECRLRHNTARSAEEPGRDIRGFDDAEHFVVMKGFKAFVSDTMRC